MAFSILVTIESEPDWHALHERLSRVSKGLVELFPVDGGSLDHDRLALGISVPSRGLGNPVWWELKSVLSTLLNTTQCRIFELYNGGEIRQDNLDSLKQYFT